MGLFSKSEKKADNRLYMPLSLALEKMLVGKFISRKGSRYAYFYISTPFGTSYAKTTFTQNEDETFSIDPFVFNSDDLGFDDFRADDWYIVEPRV